MYLYTCKHRLGAGHLWRNPLWVLLLPDSVFCVSNTPSDLPYILLLDNLMVYSVEGSKFFIIILVSA